MALNCLYLWVFFVFISVCVRIEGITATEDNYLHYTLDTDEKFQTSLPRTKFIELEKEFRVRRYVNGPISKLADSFYRGKTKFYSDPSALTDSHSGSKPDTPVAEEKIEPVKSTIHDQPVHDNRVHTAAPPLPSTTPIVDNKPPRANVSTGIVLPEIGPTVQSTTNVPSMDDDDDLPILPSDKLINNTIKQNNITQNDLREDNHIFYNSSFIINSEIGQSYWVNMEGRNDVITNDMLSKSHRRAATVKLMFNFPFYGHMVRNVTIATGGFLYTGEYVHSWLAATQYIAPLMANFDTSISNGSFIKYVDNGTAFTVQWEKVVLQDKPDSGDFTFQATLHSNGDIVFVYQTIPVEIENIQDDQHPVKVGLSDAYIIDRTIFFVRRKTIYEYHRVNFKKEDIKNWTVIYLKALPTCLDKKDCESCLTEDIGFECIWCPGVKRCSTGMDRMRQDWLHKQCDKIEKGNVSSCNMPDPKHSQHTSGEKAGLQIISDEGKSPDDTRIGMSSILGVLFLIGLICGVGIWTLYAYNNPHSSSGQILIRYRPSQWSWRRGEARYTAATIHM